MSSLAQLADLTNDLPLLERARAFYDNGLWEIRDAVGWVVENGDATNDRGEVNNTGDIVETALILGRWGWTQYYDDAELILRGHLLPSQLRDTSFIEDPPNPNGEDGLRDVADRHLGAYGFPAPYGHQAVDVERVSFNMDIVGGAVGSLCEAYRDAARFVEKDGGAMHRVNLLFDHETPHVRMESIYTHDALRITLKTPGALWVRLPGWLDTADMKIEGNSGPARFTGGYLFVPEQPVGQALSVTFDLPTRQIVLDHRSRDIRVRLRGDEVVAMDNFGVDLTYFEPYDG